MSSSQDGVLGRVAKLALGAAAGASLLMTALVVLASVMRYVFGAPFRFTEELVALLYSAILFLTMPLCTLRNQHIGMPLVVDRVRPVARRGLRMLASLVTLAFALWFSIEAIRFAAFSREIGARSEQVDLLLWPWMAVMPASMIFVAIIVVAQLARGGRAAAGQDDSAAPASSMPGDPL